VLTMGEVHTGLLQHSTAMPPALTAALLDIAIGQRVRRFERPIAHAVSPDMYSGIDCVLPSANGARVRGVGTVVSRALITGGHVLQGSSYVDVVRGRSSIRQPWSHYLAQLGTVETIGKSDGRHIVAGFLAGAAGTTGAPAHGVLDLSAISDRAMDAVQLRPQLDRRVPFRSTRTRLRWAVTDRDPQAQAGHDDGCAAPTLAFTIESDTVRTVSLPGRGLTAVTVANLCECLALHDWLLTTLLAIIERSRIGSGSRGEVVRRLAPAVDYLLHLWMPAARVDSAMADLWESLEHRGGFTRQWQASVARVRDQVALATLALRPEPSPSS
jgi:hypothetical protein